MLSIALSYIGCLWVHAISLIGLTDDDRVELLCSTLFCHIEVTCGETDIISQKPCHTNMINLMEEGKCELVCSETLAVLLRRPRSSYCLSLNIHVVLNWICLKDYFRSELMCSLPVLRRSERPSLSASILC